MGKVDQFTMRFLVTVAVVYCALIAVGFGSLGVACAETAGSIFGSRTLGYTLLMAAAVHGVVGVCIWQSFRSGARYRADSEKLGTKKFASKDSEGVTSPNADWPPVLRYGLIFTGASFIVVALFVNAPGWVHFLK